MNVPNLRLPDTVLDSAAYVMSRASHVRINQAALDRLKQPVLDRLQRGADSVEDAFGTTGDLEGDVNLIFFETAANFCFWAQDDADKWKTEYNGEQAGGWYGLSRAFYKAVQAGTPVHDASFMSRLTTAQAAEIFAGTNGNRIPLLEFRVNNIIEAANYLLAKHSGSAVDLVESCGRSAPRIAETVATQLCSFRDGAWYGDRWVWILKRAQILPSDLSQLNQKYPDFQIIDIDRLTVFADYRIPLVLQHYGVLQYTDELMTKIKDKQLIPGKSAEEVEIRMATVMAGEQLKARCPGLTAADIDLALWLLSQDMRNDPEVPPHHMTYSYFY